MVAGLVTAHVRRLNLPDTARLATASSLGAITSASRTLPDHATLTALAERVTVTQVETPAITTAHREV